MTALSFGSVSAGATVGNDGAGLRRRGGRWRLRDWRLRTKLTAVLLVPLVLAGVLGVLRVTDLGREANALAVVARQVGFAQQVALVVHDLQAERQLVAAMLATGRPADRAAPQTQAQRVDAAVTMLRTADVGAAALAPAASAAYRAALDRLSGLAAVRQNTQRVDGVSPNAVTSTAVTAYSEVIAALLNLHRRVLDGTRDSPAQHADGLKALAAAKEQASQQHAVLLAAILSGVLPAEQQIALRAGQARFDVAAGEFDQAVPGAQLLRTKVVIDRQRLLDAALDRAARAVPLQTAPGDWSSAAAGTVEGIRQGEITQLNELRTATAARSDRAWNQAVVNGATVAALLVLAVVTLLLVVRSLLQPLRTLRTAAFDVADRKLPEAVEQLGSTDDASGQTTVDPVPVHSREEVGQVARAFDTVHAQAVRLAAEQAVARNSLNDTFRNLSGRNQDLVERQRKLIDELRSREHDPELLSGLGRLDHLAARMRRHSDNLLVLAGGRLPPSEHQQVAALDVVRSAVSKVEQHQRVTVCRPPAVMVAGPVVNDVVHLIAELLDNAVNAAPQATTVTLSSTLTEDERLRVEIVDLGPGLSPDELRSINDRLASSPAVDASVSRQMGLFVVSRLAAQHGIAVRLRRRLGQVGIAAEVSVPRSLVSFDINASNDGSTEVLGSTDWNGTDGQLPLQVSVVDETTVADLFSPASIGIVTSQRSSPRTAEQDWLELLGADESAPERIPDPLGGGTVAAGDALASPLPLGSAGGAGQPEVREEIFEMVSAWFRERQSVSPNNYELGDTTEMPALRNGSPPRANAHEWRTPLDEGWQAAQALRTPADHGVTHAGLPKRQPLARLVSGVDGVASLGPAPMSTGPARTADEVRGRLSRYQQGLRVGRHARIGPDEQPTVNDTLYGRLEEDQ
ncbi:MAG TPA: nitrate- and nitrite sensing domain-containing protein [Pseudonocardiaceae bacterium]|nr:nitrate- and nitrite sensing domain-containing protein [Pseudonocardiaceae bacterium]